LETPKWLFTAGLFLSFAVAVANAPAGRAEADDEVDVQANVATQRPSPVQGGSCLARSDCGSPVKGGLRITFTGWSCTTGFVARDRSGGKLYAITAGHCIAGSGLFALWLHHGSSLGHAVLNSFQEGSSADAAAIEIEPFARSNYVYASGKDDIRAIHGSAPNRDQVIGSPVCASGSTSGWTCGHIAAADVDTRIAGKLIRHTWWTDFASAKGDSGAPLLDPAGHVMGIVIATTTTQSVYSTIDGITAELDVRPCLDPSCN
jgi:hypothetical protein